ncbi:MAG TPA: prolyl oligopeptidase family serine peptidase [Candidatus Angelobacter sp.]|nr:prolyl oligopeptidase family serine peptidase [Candidatus Angelobacter sp.]
MLLSWAVSGVKASAYTAQYATGQATEWHDGDLAKNEGDAKALKRFPPRASEGAPPPPAEPDADSKMYQTKMYRNMMYQNMKSNTDMETDGQLIDQIVDPASPYPTYQELERRARRRFEIEPEDGSNAEANPALKNWQILFPEKDYEEFRTQLQFECLRIRYLSDGLKVVGYIYKPKNTLGRKYPVVIYNRGGNREFAEISLSDKLVWYRRLAKQGFVVIASSYRGNDGGEGKEEFGGADVQDVMALATLAKALPYADPDNLFMYGVSRGGMMTYEAIKNHVAIRAAAVDSGLVDLESLGRHRPEMISGVYRELMPDFDQRASEHYRLRSATQFADKIDVPLLILHGADDDRVPAADTLRFAGQLQELGKKYELVIYEGDEHGLLLHQNDSWPRIVQWFNQFKK